MNNEDVRKTAIFAEDHAFGDRRRLGMFLVPPPESVVTMPAELVDEAPSYVIHELAEQYPGAQELWDGTKSSYRPFVYAGYNLRSDCEMSLHEIAARACDALVDYNPVISETDSTTDILDVFIREHLASEKRGR